VSDVHPNDTNKIRLNINKNNKESVPSTLSEISIQPSLDAQASITKIDTANATNGNETNNVSIPGPLTSVSSRDSLLAAMKSAKNDTVESS